MWIQRDKDFKENKVCLFDDSECMLYVHSNRDKDFKENKVTSLSMVIQIVTGC